MLHFTLYTLHFKVSLKPQLKLILTELEGLILSTPSLVLIIHPMYSFSQERS